MGIIQKNDDMQELVNPGIVLEEDNTIIRVVGVGGGGGNSSNHIYEKCGKEIGFIAVNTDRKALDNLQIPVKIALGDKGLGSGCDPTKAQDFAVKQEDELREKLQGTEMVFITAGLGKGTGTGASPVVARVAKDMGILTVAVVTLPFGFEGKRFIDRAISGLDNLRKNVDGLVIIANNLIRDAFGDLTICNAFSKADEAVASAINSISSTVLNDGYVQIDMADLRTVLTNSGDVLMGVGRADGENRAALAIRNALDSPLFLNKDINDAKRLIVNFSFSGEHEITMDEMDIIKGVIEQRVGGLSDELIWGTTQDDTLGDTLRVTIVVAGLKTLSSDLLMEACLRKTERKKVVEQKPVETPVTSAQPQTAYTPASQPKLVITNEVAQPQPVMVDSSIEIHKEQPKRRRTLDDLKDEQELSSFENTSVKERCSIMGDGSHKSSGRVYIGGKNGDLFVHNDFLNDNVD